MQSTGGSVGGGHGPLEWSHSQKCSGCFIVSNILHQMQLFCLQQFVSLDFSFPWFLQNSYSTTQSLLVYCFRRLAWICVLHVQKYVLCRKSCLKSDIQLMSDLQKYTTVLLISENVLELTHQCPDFAAGRHLEQIQTRLT